MLISVICVKNLPPEAFITEISLAFKFVSGAAIICGSFLLYLLYQLQQFQFAEKCVSTSSANGSLR
jgi:hypothetical protein